MAPVIDRVIRRGLPRLALLAVVWGTLTGGVFSGCRGLFTPAIPEPPSGKPIVLDYRTPDAVLKTMRLGIEAKGQGFQAWTSAFADPTRGDSVDYQQVFDPADVSIFEGACQCPAPTEWRVKQEGEFYSSFLEVRQRDEYAAVFDSVDANPDQPPIDNKAVVYRRYTVQATDPDTRSTLIIAIGYARLTFTEVEINRWAISRWEDQVDPAVGANPSDEYQLTLGRRRMGSTR